MIGPMSRFSEYIQVETDLTSNSQLGTQGFAKYIYPYALLPLERRSGQRDLSPLPFRRLHPHPFQPWWRYSSTSVLTAVLQNTTLASGFVVGTDTTMHLTSGTGFGTSGTVKLGSTEPPVYVTYTGKSTNDLTGCVSVGSGTLAGGTQVVQGTLDIGQTYLLEEAYCSISSRNDPANNIMMYVDIFVSGEDDQSVFETFQFPPTGNATNNTPSSQFYHGKYERDGTTTEPTVGNWLQFPANQPIISLPSSITIGATPGYSIPTTG